MHLIDQQLNLMIRGKFAEGWKLAEQLEAKDPTDPRAKFNRGWFLINQGKLQEGFQCLEYGRALKVYGSGKLNTTKPIWNGQDDLRGKTVILNMEAGFGDQIIYARFTTEVWKRGGVAILCCAKSLHSIFSRIPGTHKCITLDEVSSTFHDYWIPGFSCSWLFGHTFETLPNETYIFPKQESVDIWKDLLNTKKIKIGIRWSGNPLYEHQQFRIFPAEKLINLYKNKEHIQFYSLQRDTDLRELPDEIIDLQHLIISWEDTVACIQNLDLVITSCTSVAHIASALGKPTWVIVPILSYHIWATGDKHSPWYQNTTRVFRQTIFGKWEDTFEEVSAELKKLFPKPEEEAI
jgi:hypothetical protein